MVCQVIEASREKLPSNLAENFEGLAKAEAKNKSQLFKEMLTLYERARTLRQPSGGLGLRICRFPEELGLSQGSSPLSFPAGGEIGSQDIASRNDADQLVLGVYDRHTNEIACPQHVYQGPERRFRSD